jgi:ribosomal protein L11 methyltransferase
MRTWPAVDVVFDQGAGSRRPDLFAAALTDYDVAAVDEPAEDRWRVFFHTPAERDRALVSLSGDFDDLTLVPIDVPDENWAARSQAALRAIHVGRVAVAPPWDIPADRGDTLTIVIQPSMGFGTGHHATTRLCLAALQQHDLRGRTVLDVGTGSGVLAITSRMLGAADVLGIDDDGDAIQSARENVALNHGVHIELQAVDLKTVVLTPFDFVIANLTGGLLMSAAEQLRDVTAPAGRLILSGFTQAEEVGVLAAFPGFHVADRSQEDEWMCVTLQRQGAFV